MHTYRYTTDCVSSTSEAILDMRAHPRKREVGYRTFRRRCRGLQAWAKARGYDRDLPLCSDWHVSYYRSVYLGTPCYYLVWSGIEHIWTLETA